MTDDKKDSAAQEAKSTPKAKEAKRDVLGPVDEDGVERFGTKVK